MGSGFLIAEYAEHTKGAATKKYKDHERGVKTFTRISRINADRKPDRLEKGKRMNSTGLSAVWRYGSPTLN
jgi:hypothetical protein